MSSATRSGRGRPEEESSRQTKSRRPRERRPSSWASEGGAKGRSRRRRLARTRWSRCAAASIDSSRALDGASVGRMYGSTPAGGPAMDELASREKVEAEWR
jgi:hypothetical protein